MNSRRNFLQVLGMSSIAAFLPYQAFARTENKGADFRFCLNTSTISGQDPGLLGYIEIAAKAGYDGIELWIRDIQKYLQTGGSLSVLRRFCDDSHIQVESAIGFAPWLAVDETESLKGFLQMKNEMEMLAELGCTRIAAPAAGVSEPLDLHIAGEKYARLLEMGRDTGVMPQLEFWGASPALYNMAQAMVICAYCNDPDARILTDVYHMFRGGSGFESLSMLSEKMIEVFHMNDYPRDKPRESQTDADRVYPDDGVAPIQRIIQIFDQVGGTKVLSLELFNKDYWSQDPLLVAETGLKKMKDLVKKALQ